MSHKLSRRKFGQLAVAGAVVSGLSYLGNKALAQTPSFKIIGISSGSIINTDQTAIPEVNTTESDSTTSNSVLTDFKPVGLGLVLQSFVSQSLNTGKVQVISPLISQILAEYGAALVDSNQALSVFNPLSNGTLADRITALTDPNKILNDFTSSSDDTDADSITNLIDPNQILNDLDLTPSSVAPDANRVKPLVKSNEILSGFTCLKDGTLVVAVTPVTTSKTEATSTRITFLSTPVKTLIVSGLKQNQQLGSLLGTNDGRLIGLVGKKNGTPPIRLVDINIQTGEISFISKVKFLSDERVSNLAECPDGKLYTSLVASNGDTTLVQLDSQKNPIRLAQLKLNGRAWNNGLQSLVCSATGQLLAFGAMRYEAPNAVYSIDKNTGNMTRVQDFDASQITLARG
ncbi:MAG: hypothetical protein V7L29_03900 [Nostoc sp.]|uniref:hypothetical protein n=1 Tax=Nostoc sp. TaxID=1180 RepID=UPI002FF62009